MKQKPWNFSKIWWVWLAEKNSLNATKDNSRISDDRLDLRWLFAVRREERCNSSLKYGLKHRFTGSGSKTAWFEEDDSCRVIWSNLVLLVFVISVRVLHKRPTRRNFSRNALKIKLQLKVIAWQRCQQSIQVLSLRPVISQKKYSSRCGHRYESFFVSCVPKQQYTRQQSSV